MQDNEEPGDKVRATAEEGRSGGGVKVRVLDLALGTHGDIANCFSSCPDSRKTHSLKSSRACSS